MIMISKPDRDRGQGTFIARAAVNTLVALVAISVGVMFGLLFALNM